MKNLDVIIILNSGAYEQDFAQEILHQRNHSNDRLLWFIPIRPGLNKRNYKKNKNDYEVRTNKAIFQEEYMNEIEMYPFFILAPVNYQTWKRNPKHRLSDDPVPENKVLLIDNFRNSGLTIDKLQSTLMRLGYKDENIYSYARTLDVMKGYELQDSKGKIISEEEFLKKMV
jgi:hypothetical protein